MPVEDINAVKLGTDFLNVFESAETTSEFWKTNHDLLALILVAILLFGIMLAVLIFARYGLKIALNH